MLKVKITISVSYGVVTRVCDVEWQMTCAQRSCTLKGRLQVAR